MPKTLSEYNNRAIREYYESQVIDILCDECTSPMRKTGWSIQSNDPLKAGEKVQCFSCGHTAIMFNKDCVTEMIETTKG